mmetsp:Transcript_7158/g.15885  ORF Transcript_7158/g.15885 Transcript_7158/m.15885 type:complete len:163 (-) Transcript_7158:54-542(-)
MVTSGTDPASQSSFRAPDTLAGNQQKRRREDCVDLMQNGLVVGSVALGLPLDRNQALMTTVPDGDQQSSLTRRKESHNMTEQRRRQRINEKIIELKDMVPRCQNASCDKASVLGEAIEHLRRLQQENEDLNTRIHHLDYENAQLREDNAKIASSGRTRQAES